MMAETLDLKPFRIRSLLAKSEYIRMLDKNVCVTVILVDLCWFTSVFMYSNIVYCHKTNYKMLNDRLF